MFIVDNKKNKGHTYFRVFKKNLLTIYRHFLFNIDLESQKPFCKQDNLVIANLDSSLLDKCNNSYFDVAIIKKYLKNQNFNGFALLDDSHVIGYITFCYAPFKTKQYRIYKHNCYIENIWIDSTRRGKHLSLYLFRYCFDFLRKNGIHDVIFAVRRNNIPMLKTTEHLNATYLRKIKSIRLCGLSIWCPKL